MDLSATLGAAMQAADPIIEDSYANGITIETTAWLPGLPKYTEIPADYRAQGRQGVQATLAVLLKVLAETRDTAGVLYSPSFGPWLDTAYTPFTVEKDLLGRVTITGLMAHPATAGGEVAGYLPSGVRPAKNLILRGFGPGYQSQVTIRSDGAIVIDESLSAGWLSFNASYTV